MSHSHPAERDSRRRWLQEFKTYAREEIIAHLPFTLFGIGAGLVVIFLIKRIFRAAFGEEEFHMAHFAHIFFSAASGSAIFRSYKDSTLKALPVVLVSSILLCTLSDALIPVLSFHILHKEVLLHICALEHPLAVTLFAAGGFVLGFVGIRFFKHCNRSFHLVHILIATSASVLYMTAFVDSLSAADLGAITFSLFFSLVVPCLLGDVALPLCFVKIREEYLHEKVHHSHEGHSGH